MPIGKGCAMTTKTCFVDTAGYLMDYKTGATIRRATAAEDALSAANMPTGAFECDTDATVYVITNTVSGFDLGVYAAESPESALDAMALAAGYACHADACADIPVMAGELQVVQL